jgi:hypothetical protein
MTMIPTLRLAGCAAILVTLLSGPQPVSAQEQLTSPTTSRIIGAPAGHRQPRPADIPATEKSAAEQLEEKQTAELNRKLRICRGC